MDREKFLLKNQIDALISQIYFWNKTTCFGQFLCPSSGVFYWTHNNDIRHTGLLIACEQDQDGDLFQKQISEISASSWFYYKNKPLHYFSNLAMNIPKSSQLLSVQIMLLVFHTIDLHKM